MTRVKLKNLKTGSIIERVFRGNDAIKEASLERTKASYLYRDQENFYFMDSQTLKQFSISKEQMGFFNNFLKESDEVEILVFQDKPMSINLPIKIDLKVIESEPGIKGGRETAGTKKATLETGYTLQVPLFIKQGDIIKVDTRDGKYIERVK